MWQLAIRTSFILVIFVLYISGLYLTPILKSEFGININAEILLPIISFVFYDNWLRLFNKYAVDIKIDKNCYQNGFEISIDFIYFGRETIKISLEKLYGMNHVNAEIIASQPNNEPLRYSPPEDFVIYLNTNQSSANIVIDLAFKRESKPRLIIPYKMLDIYFLVLKFKIGNSNKRKLLILTRKRNLYD